MYKILTSRAEIAGTIDNQKLAPNKAAADLENQIKSVGGEVVSIAVHETDHEFLLVAAVEVADIEESYPAPESVPQGE